MGGALNVVLSLLAVFGPISMDLYLPVLPALTADLRAATSTAQLTVTACLFGLAFGQLIAGPLSDRFGRRRPLLAGVVAYVLTSVLCAAGPTIAALVTARFVQGLAGGVGVVIAQAAGRDLYSGGRLLRYYGRLTVLAGLAAVVGPVLGGQLAAVTDWRGILGFLAGLGVLILATCLLAFRAMCTLGAGGLLVTAMLHLPLAAVVLSLFTMVSGVAVTTPPTTSLALAGYPDAAGTASSFLGVARFAFGGVAAPLVGLGGSSAVPLGLVTVAAALLAVTAYALTARPRAARLVTH